MTVEDIKDWESRNGQIPEGSVIVVNTGNHKIYKDRVRFSLFNYVLEHNFRRVTAFHRLTIMATRTGTMISPTQRTFTSPVNPNINPFTQMFYYRKLLYVQVFPATQQSG